MDPRSRRRIEEQLLRLQRQLAEWLTTPCSFQGDSADELIACLGELERLCASWGNEVRGHIETAVLAASLMAASETALQLETRGIIRALVAQNRDFRILCHRTARRHFQECLPQDERGLLGGRHFLHTAREYRDSSPFDVLLKVGPLRSEGWGSSPSAIMSAPRFHELVQIVWHSTSDDPRFGLDPVLGAMDATNQSGIARPDLELPGAIRWDLTVRPCGEEVGSEPTDEADGLDDLGLLSIVERDALQSYRSAVLVILGGSRGVLYPPGAFVLVFDPAAAGERRIGERQVSDDVGRGVFLVWPRIQEDAASEQAGANGRFQEAWRSRLSAELARDLGGFARRLREAGLNLAYPEAAARHWAKPPSTVIHAPKKRRHFDILMKVLGIPQVDGDTRSWSEGWREVRRSRGEAIQAGMQEHARLMERCIQVLRAGGDLITAADRGSSEFGLKFNGEAGLYGTVHFLRIEAIEDGYRAPDGELRQIQDLDDTVRWRV